MPSGKGRLDNGNGKLLLSMLLLESQGTQIAVCKHKWPVVVGGPEGDADAMTAGIRPVFSEFTYLCCQRSQCHNAEDFIGSARGNADPTCNR